MFATDKIKIKFRELHDTLRVLLADTLENARKNNVIAVENVKETAELIFILVEGVYYYCGIINDIKEVDRQIKLCKNKVFSILNIV